jgi:hypothetical protein
LILQAGILGEEVAAAFPIRHAVLLVVPKLRQAIVDLLPLRNAFEIAEGQLVLLLDPFAGLG